MRYEILEVHIKISEEGWTIAVLWNDNGFVRATKKTFMAFSERMIPIATLKDIAAYGQYLNEQEKTQYFPGTRNWSR